MNECRSAGATRWNYGECSCGRSGAGPARCWCSRWIQVRTHKLVDRARHAPRAQCEAATSYWASPFPTSSPLHFCLCYTQRSEKPKRRPHLFVISRGQGRPPDPCLSSLSERERERESSVIDSSINTYPPGGAAGTMPRGDRHQNRR